MLNKILENYTETVCTDYDAEMNTFTERKLMFINNLPAFMKELMTTAFKNTPNDIVIKELIRLDSKQIIVKNFVQTCNIDYSKLKQSICSNHLKEVQEQIKDSSLEDTSLEQLEKKLEAYKSIDDTENVEKTQEKIDLLNELEKSKKAVEAAKQLESDVRPVLKPTKYFSFADIIEKGRVDLLELYVDSYREFNKQDVLDKLPHNENKYKYLCAVKKLFPNVKSEYVHVAANAFAEFIQKIYFNLGAADYNPQKMLYLYSMLGGTGKGLFMKRLEHFCNTYKIPVSPNANISSHWLSPEYQLNAVSIIPEFFPYKSNMNEQIINLNNIIDNGFYTIELKGQQPYTAKSNTSLVCGSNKMPYDTNDRRYNVVEYNNVQLFNSEVIEYYKDFLHKEYTPEDWDKLFYDAFTSCPFNFKFKAITSSNHVADKYIDFIEDLRFLREENPTIFTEPATVKDIATALQVNNDGKHIKALSKEYKRNVLKNILSLVDDGLITPAIKVNGRLEYSKYDLNQICKLKINSDITDDYNDLNDPIQETAYNWDILIKQFEGNDNNDPNGNTPPTLPNGRKIKSEEQTNTTNKLDKPLQSAEQPPKERSIKEEASNTQVETAVETAEDLVQIIAEQKAKLEAECPSTVHNVLTADTVKAVTDKDLEYFRTPVKDNQYATPTMSINDNSQFLVTARYTQEAMKNHMETNAKLDAKAENMLPVFFVYESDDLDKELQINIANALYKNNVWTITDSGHKSIHTLVYINPNQAEDIKRDFKYYWNVVAEKLYGKAAKYLDTACASVARLTRLPDGRRDDGTQQTCMFKNDNVQPIDLTNEIKKHNSELETKELNNCMVHVINTEKYKDFGDPDNIEHLRNAVAKSNNPAGQIAVELVDGGDPGSGANYIGAIGYCEKAIGPKTAAYVKSIAHKLHPTNISA